MAASSLVGALRVHLGLDSAQFSEGLAKAKSGLGDWAKTAKIATAAVVATMVTAAGAVGVAVKGMIDEADQMSKMAQQIGIPIEELSRLKYAAELSDVSLEQLGKAVKRLSANMLDIAQGGTGPAARAFSALGIEAQDATGALRPASQVIADISTKFAAMDDGAHKTALAMQIFGKSGADLIPLLNSGGEGLRDMYAEAEELGLILDERTGRAAEAFNDNLTRLGKVKDGIINKIGAGMLPALEQLSVAFVRASKNAVFMGETGKVLGATLKVLVTGAVAAGYALAAIGMTLGAVGQAAARFVKGDFAGAGRAMSEMDARIKTLGRGADDFVRDLWKPAPAFKTTETTARSAGVAIENYAESASKGAKGTKELSDAQKELAREEERLKDEGVRLTEKVRTAEEAHAAELERIGALYDAGAISLETYNRALRDADEALGDSRAARNKAALEHEDFGISGMLADLDKKDAAAAKALADLAENARLDLKNATFNGIADGLYAAADGDLGEYLASVLKRRLIENLAGSLTGLIEGQGGGWLKMAGDFFGGFAGFKTGGSFKVGGSGGADSQLMAFKATPGEMVDIRKPGQEREGGGVVKVVVGVNDDRFNAYVDQRAAPIAGRAAMAAREQAYRDAPFAVARAQQQGTMG